MTELSRLISFVREKSPFYRELYKDVSGEVTSIQQLPVLRQEDFWEANTLVNNKVLTGMPKDGIVLRSGGTTGSPKYSVYSKEEWNGFTKDFGRALSGTGIQNGDRIANLFYAGELYGSFIFTHKVIEECPTQLLSLPVGGGAAPKDTAKILVDFGATVVAALPTTIMALTAFLESESSLASKFKVRLILFAGEAMYPDQRARVQAAIPGVEIRSIGYASNDAGFLGYVDSTCGPNEFKTHSKSTIYEILDEETGEVITEEGKPGRSVVTDLRRKLMPIIRYPVGDRAIWVDSNSSLGDRKFSLLGRSEEAARIASISIYFDDLRGILERFQSEIGVFSFQLIMVHRDSKDGLVVRLAASNDQGTKSNQARKIIEAIYKDRPTLQQFVADGKVLPVEIEWSSLQKLEINSRSGKLKRIIDLRLK